MSPEGGDLSRQAILERSPLLERFLEQPKLNNNEWLASLSTSYNQFRSRFLTDTRDERPVFLWEKHSEKVTRDSKAFHSRLEARLKGSIGKVLFGIGYQATRLEEDKKFTPLDDVKRFTAQVLSVLADRNYLREDWLDREMMAQIFGEAAVCVTYLFEKGWEVYKSVHPVISEDSPITDVKPENEPPIVPVNKQPFLRNHPRYRRRLQRLLDNLPEPLPDDSGLVPGPLGEIPFMKGDKRFLRDLDRLLRGVIPPSQEGLPGWYFADPRFLERLKKASDRLSKPPEENP